MTGATENTGKTYTIKEESLFKHRIFDEENKAVGFSIFKNEAIRIIKEDLGGTLKNK